jgi:glycosyltransferase involved in cell wall biosynthesis
MDAFQGVSSGMKICIIIPAYNESRHIGDVIGSVKPFGYDIVVVDDGSTDATGEIAREKGTAVIRHQTKMGKGSSLREGFQYAVNKGYDGVIAMDADGQHAAQNIPLFMEKAREHKDSIIAGNRMADPGNMPFIRTCTNKFMSWLISLICRQKIPDSQCGFRYISCDILRSIQLTSSDFEIESEMLIKTAKKGFKIHEVRIATIYSDEKSKINPFKDTVRFFIYLFKEMFLAG